MQAYVSVAEASNVIAVLMSEQMFRLLLELRRLHSLDRESMTYHHVEPTAS